MTTQEKIDYLKTLAAPHTQANVNRALHLNGKFDPRPVFFNASVNALFPSRGADDFSDDRSNGAADDETGSTSLGVAHDLIGCVLAGEDGTQSCVHEGDHIALAKQCLENYSRDEAARKQHRDMAEKSTMVRFA
jgi:hypothetical protein